MTQNTCKQKLSCVFDHFAAVKNILMHLVFQEITIVVCLILSSYLLMLTSPDLASCYRWGKLWCHMDLPCFQLSCVQQKNILSYKWEQNTVLYGTQ